MLDFNELEHYGVLGMKWGIRRYQNKDGTLTNAGRNHYRNAPRHMGKENPIAMMKKNRKEAYKNRRLLSDAELQARISRLNLEKQFRSLSRQDLHPGIEIVTDVLGVAGPQAMKTMTSGAILYGAKVGMTRKFSWEEAADYITPKPKKK